MVRGRRDRDPVGMLPRPPNHRRDVPDWLRWAGSLSRLVVIGTSVLAVLAATVLLFALGVAAFG